MNGEESLWWLGEEVSQTDECQTAGVSCGTVWRLIWLRLSEKGQVMRHEVSHEAHVTGFLCPPYHLPQVDLTQVYLLASFFGGSRDTKELQGQPAAKNYHLLTRLCINTYKNRYQMISLPGFPMHSTCLKCPSLLVSPSNCTIS
jgi:hypothetical protein